MKEFRDILNLGLGFPEKNNFFLNFPFGEETAGFINIFKGFYLMDANKLDDDYYTKRQQEQED